MIYVTCRIQVGQEKGGNKETCCFLCYLKAIQEGSIQKSWVLSPGSAANSRTLSHFSSLGFYQRKEIWSQLEIPMKGEFFEVGWRSLRYLPGLEVHCIGLVLPGGSARSLLIMCLQLLVFRSHQYQIPLIMTKIRTKLHGAFWFIKDSLVGGGGYFHFRMIFQNTKKERVLMHTTKLIGDDSLL